jgi:prepilin-type processing-associated H-X9-DG protein
MRNTFAWSNLGPGTVRGINDNKDDPKYGSSATGAPTTIIDARPSSNHPGGCNFIFADGHLRFIAEDIGYVANTSDSATTPNVYGHLMTPHSKGAGISNSILNDNSY